MDAAKIFEKTHPADKTASHILVRYALLITLGLSQITNFGMTGMLHLGCDRNADINDTLLNACRAGWLVGKA